MRQRMIEYLISDGEKSEDSRNWVLQKEAENTMVGYSKQLGRFHGNRKDTCIQTKKKTVAIS